MPIETITKEGDFVIYAGGKIVALRIHMDDDTATISDERNGSSLITTIKEMDELRGWLTRQLSAAI